MKLYLIPIKNSALGHYGISQQKNISNHCNKLGYSTQNSTVQYNTPLILSTGPGRVPSISFASSPAFYGIHTIDTGIQIPTVTSTLHCISLPYPTLPWKALHCIALPCPALCCMSLSYPALNCPAFHCRAFHYPVLNWIALDCSALPRIALQCTPLQSSSTVLRKHCSAVLTLWPHCIEAVTHAGI